MKTMRFKTALLALVLTISRPSFAAEALTVIGLDEEGQEKVVDISPEVYRGRFGALLQTLEGGELERVLESEASNDENDTRLTLKETRLGLALGAALGLFELVKVKATGQAVFIFKKGVK